MDLGGTGRPGELHAAFVQGYRTALDDPAALDDGSLLAWTVLAGLQFVHGRFVQPLRPERTPQAAADVLARFLSSLSSHPSMPA